VIAVIETKNIYSCEKNTAKVNGNKENIKITALKNSRIFWSAA